MVCLSCWSYILNEYAQSKSNPLFFLTLMRPHFMHLAYKHLQNLSSFMELYWGTVVFGAKWQYKPANMLTIAMIIHYSLMFTICLAVNTKCLSQATPLQSLLTNSHFFCASSQRARHIKCHPKPITLEWEWTIKLHQCKQHAYTEANSIQM